MQPGATRGTKAIRVTRENKDNDGKNRLYWQDPLRQEIKSYLREREKMKQKR